MNNLVCTVKIMLDVSRLNQCHMRRKTFLAALSAQLILRELILYDAGIIFIHCQGINFISKVRE